MMVRISDLPDELYSALGRISARYGQIEHIFALTLKRANLRDWDDAFDFVKNASRKQVKNEVLEGFEIWANKYFKHQELKTEIDEFTKLMQNWSNLHGQRNKATHCAWGLNDIDELMRSYQGKFVKEKSGKALIKRMEALADKLEKLAYDLNRATQAPASAKEFTATLSAAQFMPSPASATPKT